MATAVSAWHLQYFAHSPPSSQDNSGLLGESSPGLSSSKRLSKSNIDISAPNEGHVQTRPPLSRKQSDSYDGDTSSTGQHSFFSRWVEVYTSAHYVNIWLHRVFFIILPKSDPKSEASMHKQVAMTLKWPLVLKSSDVLWKTWKMFNFIVIHENEEQNRTFSCGVHIFTPAHTQHKQLLMDTGHFQKMSTS